VRGRWLLVPLLLASCQGAYRGEPVNLKEVAVPHGPPPVAQPPPPPAPTVPPSVPTWRAWIPRQVSTNGDVIEGHYVEISPTPPAVQSLAPAKILPRAPQVVYPKPPSLIQAPAGITPTQTLPQAPRPLPGQAGAFPRWPGAMQMPTPGPHLAVPGMGSGDPTPPALTLPLTPPVAPWME
jgi:hypothetical protein